MMSFGFLDVIFGEKGLEIDTYKPPGNFEPVRNIFSDFVKTHFAYVF